MSRLTANQRKAQAYAVSRKIEQEAGKIAAEQNCSLSDALSAVWHDHALLERCHDVAPVSSFPPDWKEPGTK
jgi:hypothetical protein